MHLYYVDGIYAHIQAGKRVTYNIIIHGYLKRDSYKKQKTSEFQTHEVK